MPKIVVEGPDGRKFAFPDTMPRAEINAFMKQKYGTKARNESVQDYLARFGREQAATEARVKDIDVKATAAGRAEGERAAERMGVDNPFLMAFAAPAIGLAQQEGGRRVFEREGTVLADEAAGLSAANAAAFFVPGMVNKQFGAQLEEGRRQQPLAAFAGDIAGGFGPGEIIGAGVSKAVQAIGPGMAALGRMLSRGPGPDTSNAIVGGTLGGIAPAETAEERARNVAVGAGLGYVARPGSKLAADLTTPSAPRAMPDAMPAGGYFGRQSLRPPGSGPSAREIETQQQWSTATPIVSQARTTAQTAQQAADAALQSKAPADIARAKDQKKALVGQLQEAQASRAGMDTPEDARLAETLASLAENTSDPVLLSTQISAAKTSLDRLLTDIGSPVEGNLIPVRTNILTRTQAPRSAAEPAPERASVTRYAEGGDEIKPQGFGASTPKTPVKAPVFYSALERFLEDSKVAKASPAEWKQMLVQPARTVRSAQRDPATNKVVLGEDGKPIMLERTVPEVFPTGVTPEEIEMSGVMDWLDLAEGPVTREALTEFVAAKGVKIEEVVKTGGALPNAEEYQRQLLPLIERRDEVTRQIDAEYRDPDGPDLNLISKLEDEDQLLQTQIDELENFSGLDGQSDDTKWSSFTLPGGENYTELLLKLPKGPKYTSSHWAEPDVLAHVRFKDRIGPNGERILAIEEIQSDWHQAGRKQGYANAKAKAAVDKATADGIAARASMIEALTNPSVIEKINARGTSSEKEMLSMVQRGVHVSDQNLRGILINFFRDPSLPAGTGDKMNAAIKSYETSNAAYKAAQSVMQSGVPDAPFKDTAWTNLALNRMIRKAAEEGYDGISWIPGNVQNGAIVNAADNRGDFYDKIVVNAANKIGKKYGAKAERLDGVATTEQGEPVSLHYMRVTPELKRKALEEGFPLFAAAPFAAVGEAGLTSERELGSKMKRDKKD